MAVDVELWLIVGAMVAFIVCGCVYTAPDRRLKIRFDWAALRDKLARLNGQARTALT